MQPNIFMWSGLLKSLLDSDLHIILDVVKASKNSRYNRNKIRGNQKPTWLTIPFSGFSRNCLINQLKLETSISNQEKIFNLFYSRYKNAPFFKTSNFVLENTIKTDLPESFLLEIYNQFLNSLRGLEIKICKTIRASEIISEETFHNLNGVDLVNYLLREVNAKTYLASANTLNYANRSEYIVEKVLIQNFSQSFYDQTISGCKEETKFQQNLSCLDLLSFISIKNLEKYLEISNYWNEI